MKHRVSVTVDRDNYQVLISVGINISGLVNNMIGIEARRIKAEQWKKITVKEWRRLQTL